MNQVSLKGIEKVELNRPNVLNTSCFLDTIVKDACQHIAHLKKSSSWSWFVSLGRILWKFSESSHLGSCVGDDTGVRLLDCIGNCYTVVTIMSTHSSREESRRHPTPFRSVLVQQIQVARNAIMIPMPTISGSVWSNPLQSSSSSSDGQFGMPLQKRDL